MGWESRRVNLARAVCPRTFFGSIDHAWSLHAARQYSQTRPNARLDTRPLRIVTDRRCVAFVCGDIFPISIAVSTKRNSPSFTYGEGARERREDDGPLTLLHDPHPIRPSQRATE